MREVIYKGASKTTKEATMAVNGIYVPQSKTDAAYERAFPNQGSVLPSSDEVNSANLLLGEAGLLKTSFGTTGEQTKMRKSLKYVIVYKLLNSNYFGFQDTVKIINNLTFDPEYNVVFTDPMSTTVAAMSTSVPNILSKGYSRIAKDYLTDDTKNDILNTVLSAIENEGLEDNAREAFYLLKEDILGLNSFDEVYN